MLTNPAFPAFPNRGLGGQAGIRGSEATRFDQRCIANEQKVGTYFLPLGFLSPVTCGWVQPIPQQRVRAPAHKFPRSVEGEVIATTNMQRGTVVLLPRPCFRCSVVRISLHSPDSPRGRSHYYPSCFRGEETENCNQPPDLSTQSRSWNLCVVSWVQALPELAGRVAN